MHENIALLNKEISKEMTKEEIQMRNQLEQIKLFKQETDKIKKMDEKSRKKIDRIITDKWD